MKNQKIFEKHTCECTGLWEAICMKSTIIIDADFGEINKANPKGRMIWFAAKCLTCSKTVVYGMSLCSPSDTGKRIFDLAIKKAGLRTSLPPEEITKALNRILSTYYPSDPF